MIKGKNLSLAFLFSGMLSLSSAAMADFINLGNKLAFDQDSNRVWYTGFDLSGSYFDTDELLTHLPNSVVLDNGSVFLDWTIASVNEVNAIDFTNTSTFEAFYGDPVSSLASPRIFGGFTAETSSFTADLGGGSSIEVPLALWANRGVYYDASSESLHWYDDFTPGRNGAGLGPSDYWVDLLQSDRGPFWLVANVRSAPLSVPEPSTVFLLMAGLLGLAGFRKKSL